MEKLWNQNSEIYSFPLPVILLFVLMPLLIAARPHKQADLDLTIFPNSGWVIDSRTADLQNGTNEVVFYGIARQLDSGSLQIGLDGEVRNVRTRLEQHGWDRLFQMLQGREIRLISDAGQMIEGEVIDFSQGRLQLRKTDGRFTLIPNPHSYRLELDEALESDPPGAQLHAELQVSGSGTYPVQISYLVNGLAWSLDYSFVLNDAENRADVLGMALIRNNTGTVFENAKVRLVAGDVRTGARHQQHFDSDMASGAMMARAESVPQAEQYADHFVYELSRRLDLPERELYQFPLVAADNVEVTKIYQHGIRPFSGSSRDPQRVTILYRFENKKEQGLGSPLPAGMVRVYRNTEPGDDNTGMQLLGQDRISHIAENDPFQVMTGRAFDVRVTETAMQRDQIAQRVREEVRELTARNERDEPVTVTLELPIHRNIIVRESSLEPVSSTADRQVYELHVPAKGESTFTVTLRQQN